jgi:meiotically up-regulated gene 157 (Mug157) protein
VIAKVRPRLEPSASRTQVSISSLCAPLKIAYTELQVSTIKKKLHSSAKDGIDAVINYVDSSTNQEFQQYYEHLKTAREILIKEQQQRSVQTNLTVSPNPHYYAR